MLNNQAIKLVAIFITVFIGLLVVINISPIPQDPGYHDFADQRKMISISNFWNVISNLPLIFISFIAFTHLKNTGTLKYSSKLHLCYMIFFIGIGAVGIGSAYYHFQPTNQTLVWDRLPMTIAFMAFIAIIIGEFISEKVAIKLLVPLILLGLTSVVYWYFTEQAGRGDLRLYGLIQFLPMLIIPMILLMFSPRYTHSHYIWAMLATYFIAKIFETFDEEVFNLIGMSGHSIKHGFAALGAYLFFIAMKKRSVWYQNEKP